VRESALIEPRRYNGQFVYKYRTVEHLHWLEEIALQNLLYFPTARELNDPEEARPPLTASSINALIDKIADHAIQSRPHLTNRGLAYHAQVIDYSVRRFGEGLVLSRMRETLEPLLTRFRIYSLSKRADNSHLWAEYAARHTGYCLEFRTAGLGQVFEVRYEDDIAVDITDSKQLEPYFLFYKTKKWRREDEVRMIKQQVSEAHSTFDPTALTRIVLGRNIAPSDERGIRAIAERRIPPLPVVSEPPGIRQTRRHRRSRRSAAHG
jgi:hypothetical protein